MALAGFAGKDGIRPVRATDIWPDARHSDRCQCDKCAAPRIVAECWTCKRERVHDIWQGVGFTFLRYRQLQQSEAAVHRAAGHDVREVRP